MVLIAGNIISLSGGDKLGTITVNTTVIVYLLCAFSSFTLCCFCLSSDLIWRLIQYGQNLITVKAARNATLLIFLFHRSDNNWQYKTVFQ